MKRLITSQYDTHKETIHNFFWRALQIAGKQGVTFLIFIIAAKLLIPEELGILSYVLAIVFFLVIFSDFGISTATSKYTAEYNAVDKKKLKTILSSSLSLIIAFSLLVTIFVLLFGKMLFKEYYIYVLYLLPLVFLSPATSLLDGIYRGLKKFKLLALISVVIGCFSIVIVYLLIKSYGLIGAIISQNLFYFILFVSLLVFYREFHFKINKSVLKQIGKYSLIIGIANLGYFLYTRVDIIILGQFGYIVEIGYYEIVNKVFLALAIPAAILGQVIAPNITKHIALGRYEVVRKKIIKSLPTFILGGILVSVILYFIFPLFIKNFLPKYYSKTFLLILTILLIYFPIKLYANFLVNGFITPGGFAKIITISSFIGGFLNIILDYIFIIKMGFIGVFWVTVVVYSLHICILWIYLYKRLSSRRRQNIHGRL